MEATTAGWICDARHVKRPQRQILDFGIASSTNVLWNSSNQRLKIRMSRIVDSGFNLVRFHDFAQIHHSQATILCHIPGRRQIMGDINKGNIVFLIHPRHQINDGNPQ